MPENKVKYSVLDLVPVLQGNTHLNAMENCLSVARHIEKWGYKRIWIAEHHNTGSVVSSATSLLMGYVAQGTSTIRVGSGGIMLPNHAPLVVAEQFGTLETLYPGRIDLGLGRAPGTDQITSRALRRERVETVHDFPRDIQELQHYFSKEGAHSPVRAIPGFGLEIPIYILGSSNFSAHLAAELGLPYAFASHFAPAQLHSSMAIYHENFKPSDQLEKPYAMAGINVIIADTDEEAEYLATSTKMFMLNVIRNRRNPLPPPVKNMSGVWSAVEEAQTNHMLEYAFIGSKETVRKKLEKFVAETQIDELIVVSYIYDHSKRLESYKQLSEIDIYK